MMGGQSHEGRRIRIGGGGQARAGSGWRSRDVLMTKPVQHRARGRSNCHALLEDIAASMRGRPIVEAEGKAVPSQSELKQTG